MITHIIIRRTVCIANAVLNDRLAATHALEEIPAVIAIVPCAATDIVVTCSGELFVGKAICIAAEIGSGTGHGLVVKVIMTIHVQDDVVAAILHLASSICRSVYIKVFKDAVTAVIDEVVLTRIAEREVFHVQERTSTLDLQPAISVGCLTEVQNS